MSMKPMHDSAVMVKSRTFPSKIAILCSMFARDYLARCVGINGLLAINWST